MVIGHGLIRQRDASRLLLQPLSNPTMSKSELSRAIEEKKNQFNEMLNSMGLHEEEINAALAASDRAELHMRSGACDNERLEILHVMLEDIIAAIGGVHEAIGINDDDDDDDKNTGKRKQITARVKPTQPRIFLIHALNTWRYGETHARQKEKEFGKKIIFLLFFCIAVLILSALSTASGAWSAKPMS
jgi:hypothetical protein